MGVRVAVAGASGYAGGEVLRLVAGHPGLDLVAATAGSSAGQPVTALHPHLVSLSDLILAPTDPAGPSEASGGPPTGSSAGASAGALAGASADAFADAELVFLALPHGASAVVAARLPDGVKVVDLGADHRLTDASAWARYYGGEHAGSWTYGLPELPGRRALIAGSERVAATGCYVVASTLALAPLIAAGLVEPDDVVVVAASGTSGAGRAAKPQLLGSEVMGDVSAYKVGAHQHTPEIKQATGARTLSFTPVLAPLPRGILATVTARPTAGVTLTQVREALAAAYHDEPFVHLLPEGSWPHTAATYGSNSCHLQATVDGDSGRIVVVSAIDNLGKGAAGQAVQCANLMLGLPETDGLSANGVAP